MRWKNFISQGLLILLTAGLLIALPVKEAIRGYLVQKIRGAPVPAGELPAPEETSGLGEEPAATEEGPGPAAAPLSPEAVPGAASPPDVAPPGGLEETPAPQGAVLPGKVRPGEPLGVLFAGPGKAERAVLLNGVGVRLFAAPFFSLPAGAEEPPMQGAALPVPSTVRSGPASVRIEGEGKTLLELEITIEPRDFVSEEIPLNRQNTELRTKPDPQKTLESNRLGAILGHTGREIYTLGPFIPPVTSTRRTSFFGDRRVYRYDDGTTATSIHAGVDYGVPTGTEVRACAAGRVVLAAPRIVTGNSVVIEHLPGVYSLYYHLDSIACAEGDLLAPGDLLGRSGSTGLATGPHLHWEIRVAGENTDPDALIARPLLDMGGNRN